MATDLYRRIVTYDYRDEKRRALMEKVWSPTPWIVDVFTGAINSPRYLEMTDWLRAEYGQECWPIHDRSGAWQMSSTVNGWTWIGFDSEDKMRAFLERWTDPALEAREK